MLPIIIPYNFISYLYVPVPPINKLQFLKRAHCFVFLCFPQLLHICIEGWGNWRWSEPFSIDNVGTMLRCIHRKSQIASLIIKIQQLSGVQKQVECSLHKVCALSSCPDANFLSHLLVINILFLEGICAGLPTMSIFILTF